MGTFFVGFQRPNDSQLWLHIFENKIEIPYEEPLLISEWTRHPYFFLNSRSFVGTLEVEDIRSKDRIFLLGTGEFLNRNLASIEKKLEETDIGFIETSLTPNYADSDGNALRQVLFIKE